MADLDRVYLTQYAADALGLAITVASVATDPDANDVQVTVLNEDTQATLFTRAATRLDVGQYQLNLTQNDTQVVGNYMAIWKYLLAGDVKTFNSYFAVGGAQPAYDVLPLEIKALVDSVTIRFADMFDSPSGGPNLLTYFQANWGRGRIAQMLKIALGRLNTMAQPYSVYDVTSFPTNQWGPLLEQLTFVECVKHLRRSYLEQPNFEGASVSRLDRQSYFDRWERVLADEEANVKDQLSVFKISQMGLGRPAVLVSGGVFGRFTPVNLPGMGAQPRWYYARW